ncbi:GIY-YIG nuclease family protein [Chloroflexota bacterium]
MAYFCYILECCDGSFYTGWTTDLERRTKTHNSGKGAKYTRTRTPVRLVYSEELPDRSSAMKRERSIKKMNHPGKQKLVNNQSLAANQETSPSTELKC